MLSIFNPVLSPFRDATKTIEKWVRPNPVQAFAIFWFGIISIRIGLLFLSDLNLGPDETQYWFWSKNLDFGYFSKPPLIAWTIAFTTALFGDAEWAVRIAAPILHGGSAIFLFGLGKLLFDSKTGFWIATAWLLMPGIIFSSSIMSTDVVLLFFWSGALYFFFRLLKFIEYDNKEKPPLIDKISLGICFGLGILAKYAMVYFFIAAILGIFTSSQWRSKQLLQSLILPLLIMVAILAPNIWWNIRNDFLTISHTAANANWKENLFHPLELLEFLGAQIGILGPVIFFASFSTFNKLRSPGTKNTINSSYQKLLLFFALTPIVIVSIQAFISRAHANWGATAYPAFLVLVCAGFIHHRKQIWLTVNHTLNLAVMIVLAIGFSNFALLDFLGLSNATKRVRGWETQGERIVQLANQYDQVMADDRELIGLILYYGQQEGRNFVSWNSNHKIDDHYEAFIPFKPEDSLKTLYITTVESAIDVSPWFDTVIKIDEQTMTLNGRPVKTLYFFEIGDFKGSPLHPIGG